MDTLSIMDLAFFLTETEASPKHVGSIMIFRKPARAPLNYVETLEADLTASNAANPPFNQVIRLSRLGLPHWEADPDFNIHNHVSLHQLSPPGDREALHRLVGALHTGRMERHKPIWEFHLIDGLQDHCFAIYSKMHHAYADGITMSSWMVKSLSTTARARKIMPIWQISPPKRQPSVNPKLKLTTIVRQLTDKYTAQVKMLAGLSKLSAQLVLEQMNLTKNAVAVPFMASHKTPLTGQVSAGRQVATATVPMSRVDHIRRLTRSTLNHVALSCIDGALHRYLEDCGANLEEPITIQMPVNLRKAGDSDGGNRIGIVLVDLARKTNDPYERLREIGFTLRNVRYQVDGVPASSVIAYTVILGAVAQLAELLKLSDVLPPAGNTLVSNVPGPRKPLYLKGSKLEEMFPISALPPSNHLNITLYSYNGNLHFGLVATQALPQLNKLAGYINEAFVELEEAVKL